MMCMCIENNNNTYKLLTAYCVPGTVVHGSSPVSPLDLSQ